MHILRPSPRSPFSLAGRRPSWSGVVGVSLMAASTALVCWLLTLLLGPAIAAAILLGGPAAVLVLAVATHRPRCRCCGRR